MVKEVKKTPAKRGMIKAPKPVAAKKTKPVIGPPKFLAEFFDRADKEMAELSIAQLYKLIDMELAAQKRPTVLTRLHRRLNTQRMHAERDLLKAGKTAWRV